ncbi:hypothetical protein [Thalassotalea aquiviva]|uniref:hypothetical protein n=1 Tax=Thalassotalea aquiviva TaxID=3242415 RepID=UPI00352A4080
MKKLIIPATITLFFAMATALWSSNNKVTQLEKQHSEANKTVATLSRQVDTLSNQLAAQKAIIASRNKQPSSGTSNVPSKKTSTLKAKTSRYNSFNRQASIKRAELSAVKKPVRTRPTTKDPKQPEMLDNGIVL